MIPRFGPAPDDGRELTEVGGELELFKRRRHFSYSVLDPELGLVEDTISSYYMLHEDVVEKLAAKYPNATSIMVNSLGGDAR